MLYNQIHSLFISQIYKKISLVGKHKDELTNLLWNNSDIILKTNNWTVINTIKT